MTATQEAAELRRCLSRISSLSVAALAGSGLSTDAAMTDAIEALSRSLVSLRTAYTDYLVARRQTRSQPPERTASVSYLPSANYPAAKCPAADYEPPNDGCRSPGPGVQPEASRADGAAAFRSSL